MQQLKAEVIIQIPETHALVKKTTLEELEAQADVTWVKGMEWLKEQTGIRSDATLKENILFPNREELEKHCVDFPDKRGEHWYFNVVPMKKWLQENFHKVAK